MFLECICRWNGWNWSWCCEPWNPAPLFVERCQRGGCWVAGVGCCDQVLQYCSWVEISFCKNGHELVLLLVAFVATFSHCWFWIRQIVTNTMSMTFRSKYTPSPSPTNTSQRPKNELESSYLTKRGCDVRSGNVIKTENCWPSQAADYLWSKRRQASPDGSRGPLEGEQSGERGENGRDSGLKCSTSSPHYPSSQKYGETNSRRKKIEQLYFNLRISKGIKFVFSPSPIWCLWEIKCLTM